MLFRSRSADVAERRAAAGGSRAPPASGPRVTTRGHIPARLRIPGVLFGDVMESFSWNGGVEDPITLEFYASQTNAFQIEALQQLAPKTTTIKSPGGWARTPNASAIQGLVWPDSVNRTARAVSATPRSRDAARADKAAR